MAEPWEIELEAARQGMRESAARVRKQQRRSRALTFIGVGLLMLNVVLLALPTASVWSTLVSSIGIAIAIWVIGSSAYWWGAMNSLADMLDTISKDRSDDESE